MFAHDIKKFINEMNARVCGVPQPLHARQSSQPAKTSGTGKLNSPEGGHVYNSNEQARGNTAGPDINDLMTKQAQPRGQTAGVGTRAGGKINLEAYEAYHNSKDNALLLSQTQSEELVKDPAASGGEAQAKKDAAQAKPKIEDQAQ